MTQISYFDIFCEFKYPVIILRYSTCKLRVNLDINSQSRKIVHLNFENIEWRPLRARGTSTFDHPVEEVFSIRQTSTGFQLKVQGTINTFYSSLFNILYDLGGLNK